MDTLKPGVNWRDMHKLAEETIMGGLVEMGILKGDPKELVESRVSFLFMPHGMGHLIGLDTHDVGGYLPQHPARDPRPGLKNLRTARDVEENMLLTVEPGCYFVKHLLFGDHGLDIDRSCVNLDKCKEYMEEVGGVRIEDVIKITATGCENLSTGVPRTTEEIEACMAGNDWVKK